MRRAKRGRPGYRAAPEHPPSRDRRMHPRLPIQRKPRRPYLGDPLLRPFRRARPPRETPPSVPTVDFRLKNDRPRPVLRELESLYFRSPAREGAPSPSRPERAPPAHIDTNPDTSAVSPNGGIAKWLRQRINVIREKTSSSSKETETHLAQCYFI